MGLLKKRIASKTLYFLIVCQVYGDVHEASNQSEPYCKGPSPYRITARHIESKGIGYDQGYTTIEGFFPFYNGLNDWILFLDARGHIFDNGRPAVNAGLGMRYLISNTIWGVNSYYDYRKTKRHHYNQVALGFESLGKRWDFRLNGYLPVGKKQSPNYDLQFDRFQGHSAILKEKYEYALAGFNAEGAVHVDCWENFPLYFALGPYYLTNKGTSTWGGEGRATLRIYDYLKIEGNVSYDHLFKWIGQGEVGLSFSFGGKKKISRGQNRNCSSNLTLAKRNYQPVDRFEIIPVDKKHKHSVAIDPATGQPYQFIFVNNQSSSLGTYESPYPSLAIAESNSKPYDIIYIFPGDGTTAGLDQGITLQDYQKLWGCGSNQILSTSLGLITIGAQSEGTYNGVVISPMITNLSGPVVTSGNGNEISGLFLVNQGSNDCISATNKNNLTVLNSTLAAANASGAIGINANGLSGTLTVSGCKINQATSGIQLINSSGNLAANISNTNFSSSGGSNAAIYWVLTNASEGNLIVNNCAAVTRNNAVEIDLSNTSSITALIKNNNFCTGSYGVYINSLNGSTSIEANINNNSMTAYYQSIWVVQTGSAELNINGNDLFSTSEPTFEIDSNMGSSNATVTIANNTFIADSSDNIFFNHSDGNLSAIITNNDFEGMDYNVAIRSNVSTNANLHTLNINNNTIFAGNNAIEIQQEAGSVNVSVNNNTISALYDTYGIYWNMSGTPVSSVLTMDGNTINAYEGLYVYQSSGCNLDILFNNNIVDSTFSGINYRIVNESTNTLSMSGNIISGFAPIQLEHNIGSINATINENILTAAGNQALYYNVNSFGSITEGLVNASGNTITSGGLGGSSGSAAFLYLHATGPITTNFTNNVLSGDAQAITVDLGGATHTMNLSNNIVPTGGGFSLIANSGSANWEVNGNEFTALNSPPVSATSMGGNICMELNNNTAYPISNAYNLTAISGTFIVNTPEGNIGEITQSGTMPGPCP